MNVLNNYCCIYLSPYHSPSEAVVERSASSVSCQYSVASSSSDRGEMVRGLLAESPKVTLASGAGIAGVSGVSTFPVISRSVGLVLGDSGATPVPKDSVIAWGRSEIILAGVAFSQAQNL
jgi:hypothetical protein